MSDEFVQPVSGWAGAIRRRRNGLVQRLGVGAATAMLTSTVLGWSFCAPWILAYGVIQLIELYVFAPINKHRLETMSPLRSALGCVVMALNTALYCLPAIPLWLVGGPMGGLCATIMVLASVVYSIVNSLTSVRVLVSTIAPEFVYLALTPVFMMSFAASTAFATAAGGAVVVFGIYSVVAWQRMTQTTLEAERSQTDLQTKLQEARRAAASSAAFLAAVGHDLRTPIGAILSSAETLDHGLTNKTARANSALITDAGLMMKAMLDDLLDHSKLNAGRMTVEAADFNLRVMLGQTLRLWQGPIRAKGLTLRITGSRSIPTLVHGDSMRVRQILNNLMSNAVKFTAKGTITLNLNAWPEEPSGYALLIEVSDTGSGMTPAQLERLFKPFDQTATGVSAQYGGTGLGLSISHDLAELMGGRLTARSTAGHGAQFTLAISLGAALTGRAEVMVDPDSARGDIAKSLVLTPVAQAATALVPAAPAAPSEPTPVVSEDIIVEAAPAVETEQPITSDADQDEDTDQPLRVLIVDDHEINRRAIELILTPLGCNTASAADGMQALQLSQATAFDVIFMDVRMPELDGRETTRRLRATPGPNAETPVIAVTADTAPEDVAACMAAGMTYFVSKPLTPASLLGALQQVLSQGQTDAEMGVENGTDTAAA